MSAIGQPASTSHTLVIRMRSIVVARYAAPHHLTSMKNVASHAMKSLPMFQKNPFMSQWMSMANATAGYWRGHWMAEFGRQQSTMLSQINRQSVQFWTGMMAMPRPMPARVPAPAAAAEMGPAPSSVPTPAAVLAPAPAPAAVSGPVQDAPAATSQPKVAQRSAAPLRKSEQRRSAAKPRTARPAAKARKAGKAR